MNDNNDRPDPGSLLYGYAARAMQIYAVAELFAQHHDASDEPGPAFGLIADEALKLNGEMFELAGEIKGKPLDRLGVVSAEPKAAGNGTEGLPVAESWDDVPDDSPLYLDIGEDRDSGGSALDDLNLIHERIDTLLTAINDVVMSGEERNLLSLSTMARQQLRDANRICQANRHWSKA